MTAKTRKKLIQILFITASGIIVGILFVSLVISFEFARIMEGVIGGFIITSVSSYFELFVFQKNFRKLKFPALVLIKSFFYILLISFAVILVYVIREGNLYNKTVAESIFSDDFRHFIIEGGFKKILSFAIIVSFMMNFILQVNNLLGRGVLLNFLTGKYHQPVKEERIFMFLDLDSSTSIAEKIGDIQYHKFINDFLFDINDPILETYGEIYHFVGDEVVISWSPKSGIDKLNCIDCFFIIKNVINGKMKKYEKKYGLVPCFKAGMHVGEVVAGEVGDTKREIVYQGDVMNTSSRILGLAKSLNIDIVISDDLYKLIKKSRKISLYKLTELGNFQLKGKINDIELFSVEKA